MHKLVRICFTLALVTSGNYYLCSPVAVYDQPNFGNNLVANLWNKHFPIGQNKHLQPSITIDKNKLDTQQFGVSTNGVAVEAIQQNLDKDKKQQQSDSIEEEEEYELSVSNIFKDLARLSKEPVKWEKLLSVSFRDFIHLASRYQTWFTNYNQFRHKLIERETTRNRHHHQTSSLQSFANFSLPVDLMLERFKVANALEQFKTSYIEVDEKHYKLLCQHQQQDEEQVSNNKNTKVSLTYELTKLNPLNMINRDNGGLNIDYLMKTITDTTKLIDDETTGLDKEYLSGLLNELIEMLESRLKQDERLYQEYLKSIGEIDEDLNASIVLLDADKVAATASKKNHTQEIIHELDLLNKEIFKNVPQHLNNVEEAVACSSEVSELQLSEALNRLRQVAKNEFSSAISLEVVTLAQAYFIYSLGVSGFSLVSDAYLDALKWRFMGQSFKHLADNLPVLTVIDKVYGQVKRNIFKMCSPVVSKDLLSKILH